MTTRVNLCALRVKTLHYRFIYPLQVVSRYRDTQLEVSKKNMCEELESEYMLIFQITFFLFNDKTERLKTAIDAEICFCK